MTILNVLELCRYVSCSSLYGSRVTSVANRPKFKVRAIHVVRGFDFCELEFTRFTRFFNFEILSLEGYQVQ